MDAEQERDPGQEQEQHDQDVDFDAEHQDQGRINTGISGEPGQERDNVEDGVGIIIENVPALDGTNFMDIDVEPGEEVERNDTVEIDINAREPEEEIDSEVEVEENFREPEQEVDPAPEIYVNTREQELELQQSSNDGGDKSEEREYDIGIDLHGREPEPEAQNGPTIEDEATKEKEKRASSFWQRFVAPFVEPLRENSIDDSVQQNPDPDPGPTRFESVPELNTVVLEEENEVDNNNDQSEIDKLSGFESLSESMSNQRNEHGNGRENTSALEAIDIRESMEETIEKEQALYLKEERVMPNQNNDDSMSVVSEDPRKKRKSGRRKSFWELLPQLFSGKSRNTQGDVAAGAASTEGVVESEVDFAQIITIPEPVDLRAGGREKSSKFENPNPLGLRATGYESAGDDDPNVDDVLDGGRRRNALNVNGTRDRSDTRATTQSQSRLEDVIGQFSFADPRGYSFSSFLDTQQSQSGLSQGGQSFSSSPFFRGRGDSTGSMLSRFFGRTRSQKNLNQQGSEKNLSVKNRTQYLGESRSFGSFTRETDNDVVSRGIRGQRYVSNINSEMSDYESGDEDGDLINNIMRRYYNVRSEHERRLSTLSQRTRGFSRSSRSIRRERRESIAQMRQQQTRTGPEDNQPPPDIPRLTRYQMVEEKVDKCLDTVDFYIDKVPFDIRVLTAIVIFALLVGYISWYFVDGEEDIDVTGLEGGSKNGTDISN